MSEENKSILHQPLFTSKKSKTILLIAIGLTLLTLAILVWAVQKGKLGIFADEGQTTININSQEEWLGYAANPSSIKVYNNPYRYVSPVICEPGLLCPMYSLLLSNSSMQFCGAGTINMGNSDSYLFAPCVMNTSGGWFSPKYGIGYGSYLTKSLPISNPDQAKLADIQIKRLGQGITITGAVVPPPDRPGINVYIKSAANNQLALPFPSNEWKLYYQLYLKWDNNTGFKEEEKYYKEVINQMPQGPVYLYVALNSCYALENIALKFNQAPTESINLKLDSNICESGSKQKVSLSWTAGYQPYSLTIDKGDGTFERIFDLGGNSRTVEQPKDKTYKYKVEGTGINASNELTVAANSCTGTVVPDKPTGFSASAVSGDCHSLKLSWDKVEGTQEYYIYNSNGVRIYTMPQSEDDVLSWVHSPLEGNTSYTYSLKAANQSGESEAAAATGKTSSCSDSQKPTTPANFKAELAGDFCNTKAINLTWNASTDDTGIDHYQITGEEIPNESGVEPIAIDINAGNVTSYSIADPRTLATYKLRVTAYDIAGNASDPSPERSLSIPECPPIPDKPATPTNLRITDQNRYQVDLAWDVANEENIAGYKVYLGTKPVTPEGEVTYTLIGQTVDKEFTAVDDYCLVGVEYSFYVKSYNSAGIESDASNIVKPSINCAQGLDQPQNLTVTPFSQNTLVLNWDPVTGADGYDIYDCEGKYITSTTEPYFVAEGLKCATEYCYYVVAKNNQDEHSAPSEKKTGKTRDCGDTTTGTADTGIKGTAQLVSTGGSLWFNIILALALTAGLGYFIFRSDIWKK